MRNSSKEVKMTKKFESLKVMFPVNGHVHEASCKIRVFSSLPEIEKYLTEAEIVQSVNVYQRMKEASKLRSKAKTAIKQRERAKTLVKGLRIR